MLAQNLGQSEGRPFLSVVSSLNVQRRDDALYLLADESGKVLTQKDVCKTQVLADVFHVIQTGKVIFGGPLHALPHGAVSSATLNDCKVWANRVTVPGAVSLLAFAPLRHVGVGGTKKNIDLFTASPTYARASQASWDWFSDHEQQSIRNAFAMVKRMTWEQAEDYFHNPNTSAIGYAYDAATRGHAKPFTSRVEMNWFDVLDGAEKIEKKDVSYARTMLGLWV